MDFSTLSLQEIIDARSFVCACGQTHATGLRYARVAAGAVKALPAVLAANGIQRPFVVCDVNTRAAAWPQVQAVLEGGHIPYTLHVFLEPRIEPDEHAVGALTMAFDRACDAIIAVGSGVLHDCCKILAKAAGKPELVVATAPSMDGYASNSSAMIRGRVKVTMPINSPVAIIGDTDILCQAPMHMLHAGLGDMLAKYPAQFEWRLSNIVTGEPHCSCVTALMRASLRKCVGSAPGLLQRDPEAVVAMMEGLILSGIAMDLAQSSRPASGLEHYFSHMWEMMALDRNQFSELHGIQVGVGVSLSLRILDKLLKTIPDFDAARRHVAAFDPAAWESQTRRIFGKAADAVLRGAAECQKNDPERVLARIDNIQRRWPDILQAAREELPPTAEIYDLMRMARMPIWPADIGITPEMTADALIGSRDIRDKYLTSSLLWDLGLLNSYAVDLAKETAGLQSK